MANAKTSSNKHERTCIVCRNVFEKQSMLRIVASACGDVFVDETGKVAGRGAYVCSTDCLGSMKGANSISRALRKKITGDEYAELLDRAYAVFASK